MVVSEQRGERLVTITSVQRFVKPSTIARMLGVTDETVRNWIKAGRIEARKTPTKQYLVPWDEFVRLTGEGSEDGANLL